MQEQLETAFHVDGQTVFDQEFWNRFVRELAARLRAFESIKISWDDVSRQGIDLALERINEAILPAAERIRRLTELGFLVATSETPATLELGAILQLEVTAGDPRDLFTPSPFLLLGRALTPDDYGVGKLRTYDRQSGILEVEVVAAAGDPGPHSDWSIGALAGSTVAQLAMLEQARDLFADFAEGVGQIDLALDQAAGHRQASETARDEAVAARGQAVTYRNEAQAARTGSEAARDASVAARERAEAAAGSLERPIPAKATPAELRALTASDKYVDPATVAAAMGEVALVDAATVTPNLAAGQRFTLATTAAVGTNRILGAPANAKPGTTFLVDVTTDVASRTLAFASAYKFPGGNVPPISTTAGARDSLTFYVKAADVIDFRGIAKDIR